LNDADKDGICGDADNCPDVSNADQADSNHDRSGDACQPTLTLYGSRHSGDELEIVLSATDPQNNPLSGLVEIFDSAVQGITLPDSIASGDCNQGFLPGGVTGKASGLRTGRSGRHTCSIWTPT